MSERGPDPFVVHVADFARRAGIEPVTQRLFHAWYSPSEAAVGGTCTYRHSVTGEAVEITEVSESGVPRPQPDAKWVGVVDGDEPIELSASRIEYLDRARRGARRWVFG